MRGIESIDPRICTEAVESENLRLLIGFMFDGERYDGKMEGNSCLMEL